MVGLGGLGWHSVAGVAWEGLGGLGQALAGFGGLGEHRAPAI